jgi:hypothetical protein
MLKNKKGLLSKASLFKKNYVLNKHYPLAKLASKANFFPGLNFAVTVVFIKINVIMESF